MQELNTGRKGVKSREPKAMTRRKSKEALGQKGTCERKFSSKVATASISRVAIWNCKHIIDHGTTRRPMSTHPDGLVDGPRCHDVHPPLTRRSLILPVRCRIPCRASDRRSSPDHGRDEMIMRVDSLAHSTRFEIPYPDRLVVGSREQEFTAGMECYGADPIVVAGLHRGNRMGNQAPTDQQIVNLTHENL